MLRIQLRSVLQQQRRILHRTRSHTQLFESDPLQYLTGGLPLAVGDFVVVPVGNRNAEKTGRVTDVFVCSAQDAPYPPEKAKFVLRKAERPATPEEPTFRLPPSEQDEPKKPKRRIPWGWLTAAALAAFVIFAVPPLERIAETNRQQIAAQQAAEQEKREREERRAEQARLEEEAAAQRRREEKQARIEALQNADLPYPGMPYDEISSTKLGRASKVTHEMRSGQVCYCAAHGIGIRTLDALLCEANVITRVPALMRTLIISICWRCPRSSFQTS